ncbi:MAG TPA: bifunctional diaminohydroxyphosphoribosylaminopyrimidine deaminase/5-amino-6-(5-phosphoribosylamino)uracil reductase RibD [Candidatus Omnitrophota bacterium]|nr:bifunctional diaminohydroxyphosphoribosylaminopyrimidine deaminase/5-amino-6-(5-phosphoribosylamino)uracil reductase RibD [Candidatus Omnitrophota bacterium]HPS20313.1 bifunctional diaminohydroxyphosphoribosylaminopyrimidine deaminase/5-amino-6-(5-phosphoribosylamino)uracil reductase RibD [Candidatus Omnitrophota bacterium]
MNVQNGERYMRLALDLARKAEGCTYPNPMVGAVIVRNGRIIGKGYHAKAGSDHAEVLAIKDALGNVRGAELYVTLEPCGHYGKTPPCVDAIIRSGIKKVYAAILDPNPVNNGESFRILRKAGIQVNVGLCEKEAREMNRQYLKFITTGMPYVTVKLAESLDGKIAARDGSSKWITSEESRRYVKAMRPMFDAIMVGANTVASDDPFLLDEKHKGYPTRRIVVDTKLRISVSSNIIKTACKSPVIVATTTLASPKKIREIGKIKNVELLIFEPRKGKVPLDLLLRVLGRENIVNLLIEGGGEIIGGFFDSGLIDEWMFFIAPMVLGGPFSSVRGAGVPNIKDAVSFDLIDMTRFGKDIFVRGRKCSQG